MILSAAIWMNSSVNQLLAAAAFLCFFPSRRVLFQVISKTCNKSIRCCKFTPIIKLQTKIHRWLLRLPMNVSTAGPAEPECPNNAIYEGGVEWQFRWNYRHGQAARWTDLHRCRPAKCADQCRHLLHRSQQSVPSARGFHEEPQCAAVCPVDCCVPDEAYQETVDELMAKKSRLHI